jgi:NAD(P)-dependent dehydrogenase (short-subunit alcohol dehydrogenase family)
VDVLINTVGGYTGGKRVDEESLANWEKMFSINLHTTLNACRAAVPHMLRQGAGRIVNVAARAALTGVPTLSAYGASKSAVIRLTESMSSELKDHGIGVNCVLPGTIDTPQNRADMPNADFSKWVAPAAIADAMLFLASDAARAVSGAALPVYGRS